MLVPYITHWFLNFLYFIRVDDAALSLDFFFDKFAPVFMQWIVQLIPDDLPEQMISLTLFFLVVPKLFDMIDSTGHAAAEKYRTVKDDELEKKD